MYAALDRLLRLRSRAILNAGDLDTTLTRDLFHRRQLAQPVHRGAHHVVRVGRAEALRENVRDTGAVHDGAHGATGNDTGAWRGGLHQDLSGAVLANDLVGNGIPGERHLGQLPTRGSDSLADCLGDFVRLTRREADAALTVADRNERVERESPTALHDLRDAIDRDHVL